MKILVLNSGSSSLKSSLYILKNHGQKPVAPTWEGSLQWKGTFEDVRSKLKMDREKNTGF